jgi:hypothetical protein
MQRASLTASVVPSSSIVVTLIVEALSSSETSVFTRATLRYIPKQNKQTNSMVLTPWANYTDWATATCWRNLVPTFVDRGVSRGQRGGSPNVVNLSFLDRSRYFSFKELLIYTRKGWVDPVPDPLLLRKSGSAGNRTWDLWVSSQELWPLDHRGGPAIHPRRRNSLWAHFLICICNDQYWFNGN